MATPVGCVPDGNIVVFLQLIFYFVSSFLGFFVTIPIGIVLGDDVRYVSADSETSKTSPILYDTTEKERNFHGSCILFAQIVKWEKATIFPWSETSCDFVLFVNLAINIFYATFMGLFTLFMKLRRTRSDKIGALQDWHISYVLGGLNPILLFVNSLIFILEFCSASILTSGFVRFCNYTVEFAKKVPTMGNNSYVPTSCSMLDARWNFMWNQIKILRGTDVGVKGDNFFGCLTVASIAVWALVLVWAGQWFLNIFMSFRVCSCEIAEEKRKPDQSLQVAQRRSRMATPIGTPGDFATPGRHTPMMHAGYGPPSMRQYSGPPSRDAADGRGSRSSGAGLPPYRDSPIEEKKPIPPSDDEGYYPPPPTMQARPGAKQVYRKPPHDSELI